MIGGPHDWVARHATAAPAAPAVVGWRADGDHHRWTYRELHAAATVFAGALRRAGVRPGDRVVLALPNEPSFVGALVGCLAAGAIAVPGPVPATARAAAAVERLRGIVADCAPRLLVTTAEWADRIALPDVPVAGYESLVGEDAAAPGGDGCAVALLQYTSGSTARPRGVVVTHEMLRASCAQAAAAYEETPADVAVTWVPLFHDMGLVTGVLRPLFGGYPSVLLRPQDFVRAPLTWLRALHECGGTLSSAPNFAYDLVVRKTAPADLHGLDLRRWRVARNAGEVVVAGTLDRFAAHLAPTGFRAAGACPSYGLAEATLTVTTCGPAVGPARLVVDRDAIERGLVVPCPPDGGRPVRELVSSGVPLPGTQVRVDADDVGEVLIRGPQLTPGYWPHGAGTGRDPDAWHSTGDLGFLRDGHLFVLGRRDDTLVVRGRNYHMGDVVVACAGILGVRAGRVAAFRPPDDAGPDGRVVLVAETDPAVPAGLDAVAARVRQRLVAALDLYVTTVDFLPAGAMPVTTSGKVRTSEVRRRYAAGTLPLLPTGGPRRA